jgi:hypothetical protein
VTNWTLEFFVADDGTVPMDRLRRELSPPVAAALTTALYEILAVDGLELGGGEWLRPLGEGLHEFRIRRDAGTIRRRAGAASSTGPDQPPTRVLLRVFVHFYGDRVILLLGGYDKRRDPSERRQQREISAARRLLTQFKQRQRRTRG